MLSASEAAAELVAIVLFIATVLIWATILEGDFLNLWPG